VRYHQSFRVSRASLRTGIVSLEVIGVPKSRHRLGTFESPEILGRESDSPQSNGGFVSSQLFEARLRIEAIITELAVYRLMHKGMQFDGAIRIAWKQRYLPVSSNPSLSAIVKMFILLYLYNSGAVFSKYFQLAILWDNSLFLKKFWGED
jgi:hypothetical protein